MALLILNSCSNPIPIPESVYDSEWCHPFKDQNGVDIGASCDSFLTSKPELLNAADWKKKQEDWFQKGGVLECTPSTTMLNLKVFVEQTCSQIKCDEQTVAVLMQGLKRVAFLGVQ